MFFEVGRLEILGNVVLDFLNVLDLFNKLDLNKLFGLGGSYLIVSRVLE